MNEKTIMFLILTLVLFITGCVNSETDPQWDCYNVDNAREITTIDAGDSAFSEEYALKECRRRVCNVVIKKITS